MGCGPTESNVKKTIDELIIDRAWLIVKKKGEYINPKLRCPCCLDLVYEPIQCKECKKIYCKTCYNQWDKKSSDKRCLGGKDGHKFSFQEAEKWIITYLNTLKIICVYKNCEESIEYKKFYNHILGCSHSKEGYKELQRPEKEIFYYPDINIFVKTIDDVSLSFEVKLNTTVKELKKMLKQKLNLELNEIVLNFGGKTLQDSRTLETYNIQKNSTIFQHGRLKGGNKFK